RRRTARPPAPPTADRGAPARGAAPRRRGGWPRGGRAARSQNARGCACAQPGALLLSKAMPGESLPSVVLWEITYACPLRCTHCFSESGRRPSRQPPLADMLRIADVLVAMRPRVVHRTGGRALEFVIFHGVLPRGLASREGFESELCDEEQTRLLGEPGFADALRALAPPGVVVDVRDDLDLATGPDVVREGLAWTLDRLIVEPDGQVRALHLCEGQVGNLLAEPLEVIWQRTRERRLHPLVVE